jgi:predicted permease
MLIPAASVLIVMVAAFLFARFINMRRDHRSIFAISSSCSNTINIGLPINLALFGTDALPAVLLYYMGNTVIFWTLGHYYLAADAPGAAKTPVFSGTTLRRIISPPICGFLAGLLLLVLNVKIPPLLGIAGNQIGGMTTPLSIICIGIAIYQTGLKNIRLSRDVGLIALGRFVVSPLVVLGLLYFFPVPELMRNVFIIQASLPPMSNIALLAIKYNTAPGFASVAVSFGTLCALVTVPLFMVLLTSF